VIGLGTQDDLEYANEFADAFGITHTLLWDESFQSWAELGVSLQPSAKLYAADGELLGEWLGLFDHDEVLGLIAGQQVTPSEGQQVAVDRFCRFVDRFALAQRDAAAYPGASNDQRQRILDDLRYSANALAQTSPSDASNLTEQLAAAVRDHSKVVIDAELPDDTSAIPGSAASAASLQAAIAANLELASTTCGVALEPTASP
jgi:hypothetical protein